MFSYERMNFNATSAIYNQRTSAQ